MWGLDVGERELLEGHLGLLASLSFGLWFFVPSRQLDTWVGDNRPESDVHVGGNSVDIQVK